MNWVSILCAQLLQLLNFDQIAFDLVGKDFHQVYLIVNKECEKSIYGNWWFG